MFHSAEIKKEVFFMLRSYVGRFYEFLCLRFQLLYIEIQFNRGKKVDEFHPWLDMRVLWYAKKREVEQYLKQLLRLRERAHYQDTGHDVRKFLRAKRGWLSFHQSEEI